MSEVVQVGTSNGRRPRTRVVRRVARRPSPPRPLDRPGLVAIGPMSSALADELASRHDLALVSRYSILPDYRPEGDFADVLIDANRAGLAALAGLTALAAGARLNAIGCAPVTRPALGVVVLAVLSLVAVFTEFPTRLGAAGATILAALAGGMVLLLVVRRILWTRRGMLPAPPVSSGETAR